MNKLSDLIKKYRKLTGMAQEDLARQAGVSGSYITKIETGNRVPSVPLSLKLSEVLGIEPNVIMELMPDGQAYLCALKEQTQTEGAKNTIPKIEYFQKKAKQKYDSSGNGDLEAVINDFEQWVTELYYQTKNRAVLGWVSIELEKLKRRIQD